LVYVTLLDHDDLSDLAGLEEESTPCVYSAKRCRYLKGLQTKNIPKSSRMLRSSMLLKVYIGFNKSIIPRSSMKCATVIGG